MYALDARTVLRRYRGRDVPAREVAVMRYVREHGYPAPDVVRVDGPRQWLRFHRDDTSAADLIAAIAAQTAVVDVAVEEPAIEDVISALYGEGA